MPVGENGKTLEAIRTEIITCRRCPRLVKYREKVAREKRKQFREWKYWGKPVPGFGDPEAELVIVGLAPAAHGGNRTGRVFTGDPSAQFLVRHLHLAGFASKPTSEHRDDGLKLIKTYMTAAVKCVPPKNIPLPREIADCVPFLRRELRALGSTRTILALGKIAFDATISLLHKPSAPSKKGLVFGHGKRYNLGKNLPTLIVSYHPSPRNTQTGRLTSSTFMQVLEDIQSLLERRPSGPRNTPRHC